MREKLNFVRTRGRGLKLVIPWEDGRIGRSEFTKCSRIRFLTMGANQSHQQSHQQSRHPIPKIQFRVLIIGRANAGKTTILQRVCDTTESPTIYRKRGYTREVCHGGLAVLLVSSYITQVKLDPSTEVSDKRSCLLSLLNSESARRARHE